jgi:hypothetical protein
VLVLPLKCVNLAGAKMAIQCIEPLMSAMSKTFYTASNLRWLSINSIRFSEGAFDSITSLLETNESRLVKLDLSWNQWNRGQPSWLFGALLKGVKTSIMQYLNLSFMMLKDGEDINQFCKFIRQSERIALMDLSGMMKTAEQVRKVVKAIKKQSTILSVHLNATPVIAMDRRLQEYIRIKLDLVGELFEDSKKLLHQTK